MNEIFFTQCTLSKVQPQANTQAYITSWIPTTYAKLDRIVSLKNDSKWEDWTVISFGSTVSEKYLNDHKDDYRNQRKQSDI